MTNSFRRLNCFYLLGQKVRYRERAATSLALAVTRLPGVSIAQNNPAIRTVGSPAGRLLCLGLVHGVRTNRLGLLSIRHVFVVFDCLDLLLGSGFVLFFGDGNLGIAFVSATIATCRTDEGESQGQRWP